VLAGKFSAYFRCYEVYGSGSMQPYGLPAAQAGMRQGTSIAFWKLLSNGAPGILSNGRQAAKLSVSMAGRAASILWEAELDDMLT